MIFSNFLERALGSGAKIKIIKYFLAEGMPASENEIAKLLKISPMTVNRTLKDLGDVNLLSRSRIGKAALWKLNKNSWSFEALKNIKNLKIDPLKSLISTINMSGFKEVKEAYLFGSVAECSELPSSDIDVLLVMEKGASSKLKNQIDHLKDICASNFGNRLSVYIIQKKEIKHRLNLYSNAKRGIRLK